MSITLIAIIVGACIIVGIASVYFFGANNPVEEACEAVIKQETGMDIELSKSDTPAVTPPASPAPTPANDGNKASS